jgi:hypothetical protein
VQPVDLNLASRPFKNDTLLWVGLVVAVAALIYASWWNVDTYASTRGMLTDLETRESNIHERIADLDRRSNSAVGRIEKFDLGTLQLKADKANGVIRWKAFSWTQLFNLLQEVQPYNVQMTAIDPTFRDDTQRAKDGVEDADKVPVAVEGIAKSLADFLAFQDSLIESPHFDRVEPDRYNLDEATKEIVFRLRFFYDPRVAGRLAEEARIAEQVAANSAAAAEAEVVGEAVADAAGGDDGEAEAEGQAAEPVDLAGAAPAEQPAEQPVAEATPEPAAEPEQGVLTNEGLKKIDRRKGRRGRKKGANAESEPPQAAEERP